uniref:Malectin-like domain-containing protein n=1 Tax=Aegilops tauschii TaxID=37682 RepID=M8APZ3_AEGTA
MAASPWLLLLCLPRVATGGVPQARAQLESKGRQRLDAGLGGDGGGNRGRAGRLRAGMPGEHSRRDAVRLPAGAEAAEDEVLPAGELDAGSPRRTQDEPWPGGRDQHHQGVPGHPGAMHLFAIGLEYGTVTVTNAIDHQTAVTPLNASKKNLDISWGPVPQPHNPSPGYFIVMHFSELQILPSSAVRQFYVSINDMELNMTAAKLYYHGTGVISNVKPYRYDKFNISLHATTNSTLPPIINAIELFSVMSTSNLGTDSRDVEKGPIVPVRKGLLSRFRNRD